MSAAAVQLPEASPRRKARVAGVFYLLNIVTILIAVFLSRGIVVTGDPAATVAHVLAHETALRLRFALELFSTACSIVVAALLYELLAPVNRSVSLVAAFFRLVACAVAPVNYLLELAPLRILTGTNPIAGMKTEELQTIAVLLHRLHGTASDIVIVFFAFYGFLIGYLIFKSTFLPKAVGVLFALEGLGGLTILVPPLARLFPYFVAVGLLSEVSLTLALLAMPFSDLAVDGAAPSA